jgi:hypothetical protein
MELKNRCFRAWANAATMVAQNPSWAGRNHLVIPVSFFGETFMLTGSKTL